MVYRIAVLRFEEITERFFERIIIETSERNSMQTPKPFPENLSIKFARYFTNYYNSSHTNCEQISKATFEEIAENNPNEITKVSLRNFREKCLKILKRVHMGLQQYYY